MSSDSVFKVEYAKSDRSKCQSCWSIIDKDSFRFAILVQSRKFDGKVPRWYHMDCFFKKVKLFDIRIIKGFDDLRLEDQEKIRQSIQEDSKNESNGNLPDDAFTVQYAKSNRSTCRACDARIEKHTLRLSRKNYTSRRARRYGPTDDWYHFDCFQQMKKDLGFFGTAESFSGFDDLNDEDQTALKEKFNEPSTTTSRKRKGGKINNNGATKAKQTKIENSTSDSTDEQEETRLRKEQTQLLWNYRDALKNEVPNDILKQLLEFNSQKSVSGEANLIEAIADYMAFGGLEHCPECSGFLVFNYTNYRCTGDISEWTKCSYSTQSPTRKPFQIPDDIKDEYEIFETYNYTKRDRILTKIIQKPKLISKTTEIKEPEYNSKLPLNGYTIALVGRLSKRKNTFKKQIEKLGGTISSIIDKTVDVIISTQGEVQNQSGKIQKAENLEIHVVPEKFLDDVLEEQPTIVMDKLKLSTWGVLPHVRRGKAQQTKKVKRKSSSTSKSTSKSRKNFPEKVTMKLKEGAAVDPASGLEETCHVLKDRESGSIFTAVLGMVDITRGANSYYKIQLLKDDTNDKWFLFRAWGRTGTIFGNKKVEEFDDQSDAIDAFHKIFLDKTGNEWTNRDSFKKLPKKHYPIEIDYGLNSDGDLLYDSKSNIHSNLPQSVQDLIRLIFDVETMKETLLSFDIDLSKMPLGKLSRNQLNKAYQVLTELQTLISKDSTDKTSIIDANNRFYTLIPHDFGISKPQILDSIDLIKSKTEMIDNLLEIEIAYSLLKGTNDANNQHPIDIHYEKLKCLIEPIDQSSEEFERIQQYMLNTHGSTHNQYTLELKELFQIKREDENDRFKKSMKINNHQLLWHGSRTTNFAGILSQGLRIAPPEAPMTGYMFGKGVYFADMVSKSANYCFTKRDAPEGLLLLCEVALGKTHECYKATYLSADKLPTGTHSTKGCGQTIPDPKENYYTEDGILIPMGHYTNAKISHSSLLYNEYIVYNTDQIKMKYLLHVNFKFKD